MTTASTTSTHPTLAGATAMPTTTKKRLTTSAMIASFADPGQPTTPAPFGHALARLAEQRPEIVGLSADLAKYTDMHVFRAAHPERFFQMGMSEQSMMGAAAGLAEVGLVPFASTYSVFATRRAYDFLCLDIAEPGLNVNIVGALPGLTTGYGPSHQATEDLAILRGCPGLTIVDPCDAVDIEQAVPALAASPGPTYMRLLRGQVPRVLDEYDYTFKLGKAAELRTGRDVVLISTGLMTMRALQAAARLEGDHVDVAVLHVPTIKPLDTAAILAAAANTDRLVVTLENHSAIGGLTEAVASTLAYAGQGQRIVPIALPDEFLAAGALPTLHDRYGLSTDAIVNKVRASLTGAALSSTDTAPTA
jgi:transketolase